MQWVGVTRSGHVEEAGERKKGEGTAAGHQGQQLSSAPLPGQLPAMPGSELNLHRGLLLTTDPGEGLASNEVTCFSPSVLVSGQEKAKGREGVVSDFLWGSESGGSHTAWCLRRKASKGQAHTSGLQTGRKFSWSKTRQNRILSLGHIFLPAPVTRAQTGLLLFS